MSTQIHEGILETYKTLRGLNSELRESYSKNQHHFLSGENKYIASALENVYIKIIDSLEDSIGQYEFINLDDILDELGDIESFLGRRLEWQK